MDVSSDGNILVAGTEKDGEDAAIVFWDPRNASQPLATHTSTHSDDITTLSIDPYRTISDSTALYLLSGSTDCLLSLTNLDAVTTAGSEEESEDIAVEQVSNWGCSISRAGWVPPKAYKTVISQESGGGEEEDRSVRIWSTSDMESMALWSYEAKIDDPQWKTDYILDAGFCDAEENPGPWGTKGLLKWCGTNE
ncbi:hypothetical protein FRC17_001350 [Serendipita sp. 399]|nr:hypothetical protein FRC17_001350 [Serendipita sp. 399]